MKFWRSSSHSYNFQALWPLYRNTIIKFAVYHLFEARHYRLDWKFISEIFMFHRRCWTFELDWNKEYLKVGKGMEREYNNWRKAFTGIGRAAVWRKKPFHLRVFSEVKLLRARLRFRPSMDPSASRWRQLGALPWSLARIAKILGLISRRDRHLFGFGQRC